MKLITSILAVAVMTSGAWAQNPSIIDNVKGKIDAVQQQKADGSDAALNAAGVPANQQSTKPAGGAAPSSSPSQTAPATAPTTAAKTAPATAAAPKTGQTAKPAAAAKTTPANKTAPAAKPAVAKAATAPAKPAAPQTTAKAAAVPATKAPAVQTKNSATVTTAAKPHDIFSPKPAAKAAKEPHWAPVVTAEGSTKPALKAEAKPSVPTTAATTKIAAVENPDAAPKAAEAPKAPKPEEKKWAMTGKRDPFFSPIVQQNNGGSGCSTGKKCLEIGQINVRGVVKSDGGFIAVVTNSLNKAYFLHESDPVFNGYVLKITGDSVVFQENVQDKFGKPLTREVVKRILTPAV
jgi:hypothetical protein